MGRGAGDCERGFSLRDPFRSDAVTNESQTFFDSLELQTGVCEVHDEKTYHAICAYLFMWV